MFVTVSILPPAPSTVSGRVDAQYVLVGYINIIEGFQCQTKGFVPNSTDNRGSSEIFRKTSI